MRGARAALALLAALALTTAAAPAPASAGRLVLVGADIDNHCGQYGAMCRYLARTTAYVRAGAPTPALPVLVLERPSGNLARGLALSRAFGGADVPVVAVDPGGPRFAALPLDPARYSAIVVGSDDHCGVGRGGDCGTLNEDAGTGDSEAILRRAADIAAFVDAGGGVLALSAGAHGDGRPTGGAEVYYATLPTPPLRQAVRGPFALGPLAAAVGVTDGRVPGTSDELNCARCSSTHNAFAVADGDPVWGVIARGADGFARAVTATARLRDGVLTAVAGDAPAPLFPEPPVPGPPPPTPPAGEEPAIAADVIVTSGEVLVTPARTCVSRRRFRIRIRGLGVALRSATVLVRARPVPVVRRRGRLTATVDLRGLRRGRFTVAITAHTAAGATLRGARRYWTCRAPIRGSVPRI